MYKDWSFRYAVACSTGFEGRGLRCAAASILQPQAPQFVVWWGAWCWLEGSSTGSKASKQIPGSLWLQFSTFAAGVCGSKKKSSAVSVTGTFWVEQPDSDNADAKFGGPRMGARLRPNFWTESGVYSIIDRQQALYIPKFDDCLQYYCSSCQDTINK